jgi:predicted metal-binding membrane protein
MTREARELARVRNPVLLVAALAWIALIIWPGSMAVHAHTHAGNPGAKDPASLRMMLAMNPPLTLAIGWLLMLAAMMAPVLIMPLRHIRQRSFRHRQARSITLFVVGYGAVWILGGGVVLAIELAVMSFALPPWLPVAAAVSAAAVWQFSPVKQRALNRCHSHRELAAFGVVADMDALRFGLTHGMWCAVSCWALMLLPMLLPSGHLIAMAAAAFLVFSERLERPMAPAWEWRGLSGVKRLLTAQARVRFNQLRQELHA